ncbi:uncharacterized protein BKCO1_14000159 [Diplodia corticola]|uniref:Integral membrane protein n=1 Tax=Diplodia corticola TaxID=236234 RepID=A0A1J9R3E9_9PEZI|nr:uncharacterized protein BKCO1_14000159 [Diplodia corticola]OJD35958.1 integral membrane protein [Diplodia corticola]
MASDGVTGAANVSMPILMTMAGFLAISFYNVVELFVIIFTTFKQRHGLYFWSFIVATAGIAPHALGFVLKFFGVVPDSLWWLPVALVAVGFPAMVTGQSAVLYSRLHLVMHDERKLRCVLALVVFDGVVMSAPLIALAFGANSPHPAPFLRAFTAWDKVQIAVFAAQEIAISVLYIHATAQLLRPQEAGPDSASGRALRRILVHLVVVNAVVLAFDVTLLGVQYSNQYEIQTTYKGAVYSIKLKLEFSVLNNLIGVIKDKDLSFGGRGSSSLAAPSRNRFDTFTFNNRRSRGSSAEEGVFSRIGDGDGAKGGGGRGVTRDSLVIESVKYVGDDATSERLRTGSTATAATAATGRLGGGGNGTSIGIAFQPTQPLRSPEAEVELVTLESGRIVPRSSIPIS